MAPNNRNNVLITGGAGFIGSNFISYFLDCNPGSSVINLDKLTYAGSLENLSKVKNNDRHVFVEGDICDEDKVNTLFKKHDVKSVIHFAAESHVDNSISNPNNFIKTNIEGTFVLLEAARKHWISSGNISKKECENTRFHHISTDEVYGSLGEKGYFTEKTPYAPNSPYSASKASADFLVRSYFHTYGLNVLTSNCSNNYGPKQHDEKLIPTIIRNALHNKPIPIYGEGTNIRDWLYVMDHCEAINLIYHKGKLGETYLVGGHNECTNIKTAEKICTILDELFPKKGSSYKEQITFVADRPGHDFRYAIDTSKIQNELGWKPSEDFDSGLRKTVKWYLNKYQNVMQ